jgi:hypothetical protein
MAGNKLFNPSESLVIRGPLDNGHLHGNVFNPPRFAQLGGLDAAHKTGLYRNLAGAYKNEMVIRGPGATLREVPMHGPEGRRAGTK